jgi:metal-responsive CopG/Arc/MetJ family transcriptional regulator
MDLNKEAEEYAIKHHLNKHKGSGDSEIISFIAGANSKYVQAKILKAQIEENRSILRMLKIHGNGRNRLPVLMRVNELEEQLKQLENE